MAKRAFGGTVRSRAACSAADWLLLLRRQLPLPMHSGLDETDEAVEVDEKWAVGVKGAWVSHRRSAAMETVPAD